MKNIQTKKFKVVNDKTLIVTVDVSKDKHMGYCRCPDRSEMKPFEFFNNGRGFNEFWNRISMVKKANNLEEIIVGFESTGPYAEPLIQFLRSKPVKIVQVNPMHTKRLKELQGNSPNKTDYKDPKVIADIIELGHALTVVIPEGIAAELRRLIHARERSMQRRIALLNQLQELMFIIFPEFLKVMNDIKTKSAQYLIKHYPTPQDIIGYGIEELANTLRKVSRGKFGKKRAEELFTTAQTSVGITEGQRSIVLEIREILSHIEACGSFIDKLEKGMSQNLERVSYSRYILSIKGIGEITAAGIIGEVGDFSKFNTISEIEKLAGLDLFEISSGKHRGSRRISKRGRCLLRKFLYFASVNVVRKGGILHKEYQGFINRGKPRLKALIAIARKLLRIIFALVRNHSEYIV
ncbi:MAG: IS110 family transposase, partial [Nitrospirota bacterium]